MSYLWSRLFWRTVLRITGAGFVFGGLYAPTFYTLVLVLNLLFNRSNSGNLTAVLGFYILSVILGAGFGSVFGTILGAILGAIQGVVTLIIVRFVFFPWRDEIQLKYSLTASGFIVALIVSYLYFAKLFPGTWSVILIIPLIFAVIVNVLIVRKIGDWYLSETALTVSDEFQRADAGDEP